MGKLSDSFYGGDLFGYPDTRKNDLPTAHLAARDTNRHIKASRALVHKVHANNPDGLTDYELADLTHMQQNSAGKRRLDLCKLGLIIWTPDRRPGPTGSLCTVWRITPEGLEQFRVFSDDK